jgi:hypothetical protein
MKFNIGDRVRFLNDVGGGKVVKYIDNETVAVLNQDDFEIPVLMSELILDQAPDYASSGNSSETQGTVSQSGNSTSAQQEPEDDYVKEDDTIAVFLAFVPKNQKNKTDSALTLHLINDSNYRVFANVLLQYGAYHVSHPKSMPANIKVELKTLEKEEINDVDSINVQVLFYKNEPHELKPAVSKEIKINPLKFFKDSTYEENDFFDEKAHLITIIDENEAVAEKLSDISAEELKKALQTKEFDNKSLNKKPESKSSKPSEIREIDLHIHELLDQHEGMNPQEILDYQMDCFRKEMQKAIADRVKKIVFIHGKGNGSLKSELRRELKHKYRKHQFQDASFQQYGFGATMVYIH